MIPVISLLDLKHRTYIPNLISNYSFYCKQITTVHEISSDVPLAGVSTCHSQWTLNNAVNYENKQAPQHKKKVVVGLDTHRVLCVADITMWATAVMKPSGAKRKTSQLAYHNKCFWLNVSDSAAGHKAPLITVCWSC